MARTAAPGNSNADLVAELRAQRRLLEALVAQVSALAEGMTLVRADQLRLQAGQPGVPDLHRCTDPDHGYVGPVKVGRKGGRHGG